MTVRVDKVNEKALSIYFVEPKFTHLFINLVNNCFKVRISTDRISVFRWYKQMQLNDLCICFVI